MIRATSALLFLLKLSLSCVASAEVSDSFVGSVPKKFYQLMLEKECSPIKGFYDRDINQPAFVYHSRLFNGDDAIIFACEINEPVTDDRYKIVLIKKSYSDHGVVYSDFEKCENEIFFRSMPGGLAIRLLQGPLELDYNLWKHTKNYIWDRTLPNPVISEKVSWLIEERYEGTGYGFFCAEGNWYNVTYD